MASYQRSFEFIYEMFKIPYSELFLQGANFSVFLRSLKNSAKYSVWSQVQFTALILYSTGWYNWLTFDYNIHMYMYISPSAKYKIVLHDQVSRELSLSEHILNSVLHKRMKDEHLKFVQEKKIR